MKEIYKVLIVDDEGILRNGLKHLFSWEEHGFLIVGEASNGEEALSLIKQLQPHIVITDIVMPIMDGVDLVKHISKDYPHIKTIVLSSFSEFKYVREAFKYGTSDYLLKPTLKASDLLFLLQNLCKELQASTQEESSEASPKLLFQQLLLTSPNPKEPLAKSYNLYFPLKGFLLLKTSLEKVPNSSSLNKIHMEDTLHTLFDHYLYPFKMVDIILGNEYIVLINFSIGDEDTVLNNLTNFF